MHRISSVKAEQELQDLGGIPIDRIAWRVISKGEHWDPSIGFDGFLFECPLPHRSMHRGKGEIKPENLMGLKVGRLTVVAYFGLHKTGLGPDPSKKQLWVCRCACGFYVIRQANSLKKAAIRGSRFWMCERCEYQMYLTCPHEKTVTKIFDMPARNGAIGCEICQECMLAVRKYFSNGFEKPWSALDWARERKKSMDRNLQIRGAYK